MKPRFKKGETIWVADYNRDRKQITYNQAVIKEVFINTWGDEADDKTSIVYDLVIDGFNEDYTPSATQDRNFIAKTKSELIEILTHWLEVQQGIINSMKGGVA